MNGTRRILFVAPDGRRPTIRLGKVSQRAAESFKLRVEQLLEAAMLRRPMEPDLAQWVLDLEPRMAKKLAAVGLIDKAEETAATTLGDHLTNYFAKRSDVKPSTMTHWNHTKRLLVAYFGDDRPLGSITAGDAKDWERWLRTADARENRYGDTKANEGLAVNTARKRISNAKQFLQDAVSRDLLTRNPFAGLKGAVGSNRERDYFLTRADATKIIEACPDNEWKLIFALSRYGGLRCPSEHLGLTWADVNWAEGRMLIRSPKTAHHDGKATRIVPLFPELRPYIETAWNEAPEGAQHVITRYRSANVNLRTQLERIIAKAGLKPWPKLFQNLRASRATELASEHPAHVAATWLGHSTLVANKHYWQVTDDDFAKAVGSDQRTPEKAAQNAAQQAHAASGGNSQTKVMAHKKPRKLPVSATIDETTQTRGMGDTRLELVTPSLSS